MNIFKLSNVDLCNLTIQAKKKVVDFVMDGGIIKTNSGQALIDKYTELKGELVYRDIWLDFNEYYG